MKEAAAAGGQMQGQSMITTDKTTGNGMRRRRRSSSSMNYNKEKTKLMERQRRSITTKIFHGLRPHGGYRLSPRADINQVLRQLAKEAGWVVESDGTTYHSPAASNVQDSYVCPICGGAGKRSLTSRSTSSFLGGSSGGGGGGECSATASPAVSDSMLLISGPSTGNPVAAAYMYGGITGGLHRTISAGQNVSAYCYHNHYPMAKTEGVRDGSMDPT